MKKMMSAVAAVILLAACNPATGPGNKEPDTNDDNNEQQNYRCNEYNNQNNRYDISECMNDGMDERIDNSNIRDNNLNRRQFNDDRRGPNGYDNLAPNRDEMTPKDENMVRYHLYKSFLSE